MAGAGKHLVEHLLSEAAGEGVLLAHVIRAHDGAAVVDRHLDAVPEPRPGPDPEVGGGRLVPERPEADHDGRRPEQLDAPEALAVEGDLDPFAAQDDMMICYDKSRAIDDEAGPIDLARFGLAGMRERAAMIGGKLEVQSAPDYGTVVIIEIPC